MKILVLSLLRLGDIVQQKPLLRALRAKYPQAEIHMAMNRQFLAVQSLLDEEVQKFHTFDRDLLQKSMGESAYHILTPLEVLNDFIRGINAEKYDLILNWTHNRLSTYLMGTLEASERQGLFLQEGKLCGLDSPWLRYFNDNFAADGISFFHYVELLGMAFDLPVHEYAVRSDASRSDLVLLQCVTSDAKKNWGISRFRLLKEKIEENFSHLRVQVLVAPGEEESYREIFESRDLLVADLAEVKSILAGAKLLISGDTSIKHLAAEAGTPVLEISLGGSRPVKTGSYAEIKLQIQGTSPCYPCTHSKLCSQKSHLCAESVEVDHVFRKVREIFEGRIVAAEVDESFEFERAVWRSYLNGRNENFKLSPALAQSLMRPTDMLLGYQDSFQSGENFAQIFSTLQVIQENGLDTGAYFQKLAQVFQDRFKNVEIALEAMKRALEQSGQLLQIRGQLIAQSLSNEGESHESRT